MSSSRFFALIGMNQTERKILLELVRQEAPDLLHPGAVKRIRRGTWDLITRKFNESTSCTRSVAQLKSCLQSIMRKTLQKKAGSAAPQHPYRKINFTPFEKDVILNLGKQSPIVFSKLKDGKTQALKRKAWTAMMWSFNRTPGIKTQRTAREIKNCMVNMTNRNRDVEEFFKGPSSDFDGRQRDISEQTHLEGTVVLGGVPHPVTNVHGSSAARSIPQQSSTVTVQSGATVTSGIPQQNQSTRPVSKHRFLLPKPPNGQLSSLPIQSTTTLVGAFPQNVSASQATAPQNVRPALTHPVRTISVPQISMPSPQLSPTITNLRTPPQPMPHLMQAGPALHMQPQLQSIVSSQTFSTPNALQPVYVHSSQSLNPPAQASTHESSGWISDTPSPHLQTATSGKPAKVSADDCVEIIEIKEECSSDPEEVFGTEQQSSTSIGIHEDEFVNLGVNGKEQLQPAKVPTPQQSLPGEPDGLKDVHIQVHVDGGGNRFGQMVTSSVAEEAQRRVRPKSVTSLPSPSFRSTHPMEGSHEINSSGYLMQSNSEFQVNHPMSAQLESSSSTADLPSDLSNDTQAGGALQSASDRGGGVLRRERLKRRKETVGMMKKRLLQREHDLRVEMMRKEHAWMLEEHVWRREEHELRMNMIRINSKFS